MASKFHILLNATPQTVHIIKSKAPRTNLYLFVQDPLF